MEGWVRVTRLGQELSTEHGVSSPKTVLKKHEGVTGSTFSSQLKNLFGKENLEFRGKHGSTEVILRSITVTSSLALGKSSPTPSNRSSSEMNPMNALEQIFEILEVPELHRHLGIQHRGLFKRIIRRLLFKKGFNASMNYALLGQRFKQSTGRSIKQTFESSTDLLTTISATYPNMKGTIQDNTFTLRIF